MKQIFLSAFLSILVLTACKNKANENSDTSETEEPDLIPVKKISKRDYSITPENAYSDLFVDSAAMENFIASKNLSEKIARRMRSFYNARNYQYAWFSTGGLTEQALAFWNLHDYVTTYNTDTTLKDKDLQKKMDTYVYDEDLSIKPTDKSYANTELTLTQHFIMYVLNNYEKGYVKRKEMERFIPYKKQDPMRVADSLLNKKHKDEKYFENVNEDYKSLKNALSQYYTINKNGGWPSVSVKKTLKKGMTDPEIPVIKKRLSISGDLQGIDTSAIFNDTLEAAVKNYQTRMGYTPTGAITSSLAKDMNVPASKRMEQILMNMGRMRWMPDPSAGQLMLVNIPEFVLHVYEKGKKAFDMNVVVGKEGHNTMMFNGDLNQIVFSPYWNVPPSIVKKEILPKMASNGNYLASQNMEQTGTEGGLPVIRQLPGEKNSLGRVKFLFPNSFNIYFHDTPAKSLFSQDRRAFSHGCIRLSEPEKMADYLLRNDASWNDEKIREAMYSGKEQNVRLKDPVPVIITYYTAWVDENGRLNFRDDIYSHDKNLASKMFNAAL